jgi:cytoskeletal protein RodZ
MPDESTRAHGEIVNAETRHEESDVNVRALLWFVGIFLVFAVVVHVGLWLLFRFYVQLERGAAANAPMTSVATPVDANVPATPRLQPFPSKDMQGETLSPTDSTPVIDMQEMRAREEQVLTTYGYVDRDHGIVHIPIEIAKKRALESGTYRVNNGAAAPRAGVQIISGANVTNAPATQPAGNTGAVGGSTTTTGNQ